MIICRSSFLVFGLLLVACSEKTEEPSPPGNQPDPAVEVTKDGKPIDLDRAVDTFEQNPNRFNRDVRDGKYRVEGKVQKIGQFAESIDVSAGFFIPLKYRCGGFLCTESARTDPRTFSGGVSVFVLDFSQDKAADLELDQKVRLDCTMMDVVSSDIVFRSCRLR